MWAGNGADTLNMVLFPAEFPFVRRAAEPVNDAPSAEPIVEPAAAEPQAAQIIAQPIADEVTEPAADEAIERSRLMMFPAEFPFVRRVPEAPAEAPQAAAIAEPEITAPIIATIPSQPIAAIPETIPETINRVIAPAPVSAPIAPTAAPQAPALSANEMRMRERRKVKRDPMSSQALVRLDGVHGPPLKVELTDISVAGVRFRAPRSLDAGDKGQIRLEIGPLRWTTRLRVVYATSNTEGPVTIGCAFLRTELLRPWPLTAA
jgi:hypothetical protein